MVNRNSFTSRFQSYLARSYFAVLIISLTAWSGYLTAEQVEKTEQKTIDAAGLFAEKCLLCHAQPGPWPDIAGMVKLEAEEIYRVLSAGLMRELANGLDDAQRKAIAGYVAGVETGKLVWEMPGATNTCQDKPFVCNNSYMAAPTIVDSFVFAGASDGVLRGFDASNGRIIWSYDTFREFTGVNGLKGKGGSIIRGGPTIVNGMLYQTSGYGHLAMGMPGNVLLAFEFPEY